MAGDAVIHEPPNTARCRACGELAADCECAHGSASDNARGLATAVQMFAVLGYDVIECNGHSVLGLTHVARILDGAEDRIRDWLLSEDDEFLGFGDFHSRWEEGPAGENGADKYDPVPHTPEVHARIQERVSQTRNTTDLENVAANANQETEVAERQLSLSEQVDIFERWSLDGFDLVRERLRDLKAPLIDKELARMRTLGLDQYGDQTFRKPLGELRDELDDELADAIFYATLVCWRMDKLRKSLI